MLTTIISQDSFRKSRQHSLNFSNIVIIEKSKRKIN